MRAGSSTTVRFVALGDSITAGLGDPMPDGGWRGWAALLAECLAAPEDMEFHNLAEPGALTLTLSERQLPGALALRPTVAAVVVGVNDTLRGSFDVARTGRALHDVVSQLRRVGALVLTARLPDPGRMLRLPRSIASPLARRIGAVNAVADVVAAAHATVHFDSTSHPELYDSLMWSVDRLHPSERGHRLLAIAFANLLWERGFPLYRWPGSEPANPPPTRGASLRWMATKGTKWVYDRSTDLVPSLIRMSLQEWWYGARGMVRRIDQAVRAETEQAIAALTGDTDTFVAYPTMGGLARECLAGEFQWSTFLPPRDSQLLPDA
jgi:lysophospholipase L1-like esterase